MSRRILKWLSGVLVSLGILALVIYIVTGPQPPPPNSASASWLEAGLYSVGQAEFIFVDDSRPTDENRGVAGKPDRSFATTLWFPENHDAAHPLIIHSHGIHSNRLEMDYLAERLAGNGYVVAAADYPLSSRSTAGGANAADVVNQPADVSFLIDSVIGMVEDERPFEGSIDSNRIGLTGLSLGGLTTTLATFHPRWRDPRVKAAVSIAGPANAFTGQFYRHSDAPFLMIAGTADALIDYGSNALIIPARIDDGRLITIDGGSHLGFIGLSDPWFRFMHNPDSNGCDIVLSLLDDDIDDMVRTIGSVAEGVLADPDAPPVCGSLPPARAIHPGRQKMITEIAVAAFFESVFGDSEDVRGAARDQLENSLAQDFEEASFLD